MSKAEILGRLISCGFEIQEYFEHKNSKYMLYNGNEFGMDGLGIAILE